MHGKPLFDILSKLPSKSLFRFRCISKLWREYIDDSYFVSVHDQQVIEDPTPIMFYKDYIAKTLCFHTCDSETITNNVLKVKNKVGVLEFVDKKLPQIIGSCNGLVLIMSDDDRDFMTTTFTVIHPINKQCYVLPKLTKGLKNFEYRESCGFYFDSYTNTFTMVCAYFNTRYDQCTVVHVFGTSSWRKVPQDPSYRISGKAIFAHGCLHWLGSYGEDGVRQVIWFDVKNEEFGLIKPPKRNTNIYHLNGHLVNLDGQVGYFNKPTEVWVLNHKKEWVLHCKFENHDFPTGYIEVLGCLNKAGDILMKVTTWTGEDALLYICNFKNKVIHKAHIDGLDLGNMCETEIVMFPNSLRHRHKLQFVQKKRWKKTWSVLAEISITIDLLK